MTRLVAGIALLAATLAGQPTTAAVSGDAACFYSFRVARDKDGNPVALSTKQLDQMAI